MLQGSDADTQHATPGLSHLHRQLTPTAASRCQEEHQLCLGQMSPSCSAPYSSSACQCGRQCWAVKPAKTCQFQSKHYPNKICTLPALPVGRFPNNAHSQKQIFMHSLICNVDPDAQLLRCCDDTTHHTQLQSHARQHGPRGAASSQANLGPSPCPALDDFVASSCNQVHCVIPRHIVSQKEALRHPLQGACVDAFFFFTCL